jgi:hypothetical protein
MEALLSLGTCQCSEPRDEVFALLNILEQGERSLFKMLPDYTLSAKEVALIALGHMRSATANCQNEISVNAARLLLALVAEDCEEANAFAHDLRAQKVLLDRQALEDWRSWSSSERWQPPCETREATTARQLVSVRMLPGMALNTLDVLDCIFGWYRLSGADGSLQWPRVIYNGVVAELWSSDDITALA